MNIILIGMRGSGKSTVGKLLAQKLQFHFIETDDEIEKKTGKNIASIVTQKGWGYFRTVENEIIQSLTHIQRTVVATGGGVILSKNNRSLLKILGKIIYLESPVDLLLERVGDDLNRPFLTHAKTRREDIEKTLEGRESLYLKTADITVQTSKSISEVIDEIISKTRL